ncbi:hypothetical protein HY415_00680 [Candidatus Kaiserbacteria bacterium]|nr:hypothetical protein [Candidatus Kaiserbacteria bacterium]
MNFYHSIGSFFRQLRTGARQNPTRDWLVLLIFSAIALAGIVAWNVWAFQTVAGGGVIGAPVTGAPQAFNPSSLDTVRAVFESRAAEEAKYRTGAYRYADPSQ